MAIILDVVSDCDIVKRAKVILAKHFGINTSTKQPWTPDSNTRIMKQIKAMAQKIWKISIFYPKSSKEFHHQIKFRKNIMSRRCSLKKLFLKISQYSQENTCIGGISFLTKMSFNKRPKTLSKRDSNEGVFLVILPSF